MRLHRAREGAPYAGIKEGKPEKIVLLADEALSQASAMPEGEVFSELKAPEILEIERIREVFFVGLGERGLKFQKGLT